MPACRRDLDEGAEDSAGARVMPNEFTMCAASFRYHLAANRSQAKARRVWWGGTRDRPAGVTKGKGEFNGNANW